MTRRKAVLAALVSAAVVGALGASRPAGADAGDAQRVELGRRLFFDPAIGRAGRVACAACHDPEHGFSDARPRSMDETRELARHSQPLVDLAGRGFHWDGEFDTVRDLIDARTLPTLDAAKAAANRAIERLSALKTSGAAPNAAAVQATLSSLGEGGPYGGGEDAPVDATATIADRLSRDGRYDAGFAAAFGDAEVTTSRVGDALEAYVASLHSGTSAFDRYAAGDANALDASARRGLTLFRYKAGCAECHVAEGPRPAFTDRKWHDTGVDARRLVEAAKKPDARPDDEEVTVEFAPETIRHDIGRLGATFVAADRAAFKTPSLRDVARRAPYFHDASAKTLDDVVAYYAKGGTPHDGLDAKIKPLDLSKEEAADLVAFLGSLTSDERPGIGAMSPSRAASLTIRVEDAQGTPVAGRALVVRPFGDRLAGTTAMPAPISATTDADGVSVVAWPASTHVVVEMADARASKPLPDWTSSTTLLALPKDAAVARVIFPKTFETRPLTFFAYAGDVFQPGARVQFTKIRDLGPDESLYSAPPHASSGPTRCATTLAGCGCGDLMIDFGANQESVLDLRTRAAPRTAGAPPAIRNLVARIASFLPRSERK